MLVYIWLGLLTIAVIMLFKHQDILFDSALTHGKILEKEMDNLHKTMVDVEVLKKKD